jgi:hypothetical protein
MMRHLYSGERELTALGQMLGNYCGLCLWPKLLILCLSIYLVLFIYLFIYLFRLLTHSQTPFLFLFRVMFLLNECSVSNVLFLSAPPPPHETTFMYLFF